MEWMGLVVLMLFAPAGNCPNWMLVRLDPPLVGVP
jgi:hypothetical protein